MKTNYSLSPLNLSFEKLKTSHIKNNDGSITPRTTTNKTILDKIEIEPGILELYEKSMFKKADETILQLDKELEQKAKKIEPLEKLASIDKLYSKDLEKTILEVNSIRTKVISIKNSVSIQIKDNSNFGFETIYQETISENDSSIIADTPAVLRYGLNTESAALKKLVGGYIEKGVLHPYEEALFEEAINYLTKVESGEAYIKDKLEYPNNIVLVDIFDRSSGIINDGNNQSHTIALWKKKNNELVLIDPSQKSYSEHLVEPLKLKLGININTLGYKTLYGVAAYKPNDKTDYSDYLNPNPKPRDCVDIAVKVAFELNEQQKIQGDLQIAENNMLEQLSNEPKLATHLTKLGGIVIRELQSSNFHDRSEAKLTVKELNDNLINKTIPKINVEKIKNYQNVQELKTIFTNLQKFV